MSTQHETPPEPAPRPTGRGARRPARSPRWMAVLAGAALVVAGAVLVVLLALSRGDDGEPTPAGAEPTSSTTATAPPATATDGGGAELDEAERDLLAVFGRFQLTECEPAPREPDGVVAALTCTPGATVAGEGAPAELLVLRYRDATALHADVDRRSQPTEGSCAAGETNTEAWGFGSDRVGTLICHREGDRLTVYWTRDADLVALTAASDDPAGLVAWLRRFNRP